MLLKHHAGGSGEAIGEHNAPDFFQSNRIEVEIQKFNIACPPDSAHPMPQKHLTSIYLDYSEIVGRTLESPHETTNS